MPGFEVSGSNTTSEGALADAFESFLRHHRHRRAFPRFDGVYREVPGIQGVADFVGVRLTGWKKHSLKLYLQLANVPRGPSAAIIDLLKRPRSRASLLKHARYSRGVMTGTLTQLIRAKLVVVGTNGTLRLSPRFVLPDFQLYFFELKLSKWQRALAQAMQAKVYANKTYCVFPSGLGRAALKRRELFRRMGIGILIFDPVRWDVAEPVRTKSTRSVRMAYKIDVLLRLAALEHGRARAKVASE